MTDKEFLSWIYDRMIYKHGENKNVDYMLKFRSIIDSLQEEPVSEDKAEKYFKAGDVVMYVSRHPVYSGLYLLGNPNDLSIGYSNANEPYQIALRNCTIASEDERRQFMHELELNGYKWNESTLRIEKNDVVSEDFDNIYHEWLDKEWFTGYPPVSEFMRMTAEHFYKLGKQEEPASEDLEKVADKYVPDEKCKPWAELCKKAFKSGANWQKQKTISKAVEWLQGNIDSSMWLMDFRKVLED